MKIALAKNKKFLLLLFTFIISIPNAFSQKKYPDHSYHFLLTDSNFVASKNYYLLTLFQALPEVKKLLDSDEELIKIGRIKADSLTAALTNCGNDGACYISRMKFTQDEIQEIGNRIETLYQQENALGKLVTEHLIPSGRYVLYQSLSAKEMLMKAWEQDANGINFCIDVYAGGTKPNYPLIDSISFNTKDHTNNSVYPNNYVSLLYNATSLLSIESAIHNSFFYAPLNFALLFLDMNERDQAADFEPMEQRENKAAFDKIKTTNWANYKYSVIVVPGAGPNVTDVALSAEGMIRCRLAAIQFKNGLAPFIITSGGKVHPYKTKFCEALEMKKYLIEKLHIPENTIIIEPHARHTTTNMRNAARLIYKYNIPFNKPGVTCTTKGQSSWIGATLTDRCLKELKEIPYKSGVRLNENVIEFFPLIDALQANPSEPLDP
ncbi:MAG: YdcF family protein [Bacteroidota bacterium]|nr:YdcF family protein [Bacteroidota bacterium]